jgi:glutamyl-tRNA synthetase/nondiscriminating glutamyl-tRNA synthetase
MTPLRVRFAPSPTGHLHVGNARTALFNWLLARRHGGTFVLRIEDTDAERSTAASERSILEDLRWLGLDWDEGPDVGGARGPYRQSERLERYREAAMELLESGRAYYCFCTPAEIDAERRAALAAGTPPKYSGRCRLLPAAEARSRIDAGEPAAVRFAVPAARDVVFDDQVRGRVTFSTEVIGDPVILRSEGRPAYNFAVVVDDAAMAITHVIRGEDHISNTPRQILVYEALGLTPPVFAHLSLVMGPDHAPLSKRHGATSVAEFRERGYLPEALVNYLALLGWSPGEGEERMALSEMARRFDISRVSHSAAVFDAGKLAWVNRHYMTEAEPGRLARLVAPAFVDAGYLSDVSEVAMAFLESLLPLTVGSVDRLVDVPERVAFLYDWNADRAAELTSAEPEGTRVVAAMAREIAGLGPLDRGAFRAAAGRVRQALGVSGRALFHPIRVALTALESGPELDLAVPAIDRAASLNRSVGFVPVVSCAERLAAVAARLVRTPSPEPDS